MINFSSILKVSNAAVDVDSRTKDDALSFAVDLACKSGAVPNRDKLLVEIRARETLSSTGIGEGVAVPHALCDSITQTVLSVVRLARPIDFAAVDSKPVDLIFLMAGPRGDTANHLKILSKLARLLHDADFRNAARAAKDSEALVHLLLGKD
ncbi:MAG: PTS sugar transporter subunit IIA [Treponemataceae bacterium]